MEGKVERERGRERERDRERQRQRERERERFMLFAQYALCLTERLAQI